MEKIIELYNNNQSLHLYRGFLQVKKEGTLIGQVALDDIGTIIITAPNAFISKKILATLSMRNIAVVICGDNFHPIAMMMPLSNHHKSHEILWQQIEAAAPLKKRLWQYIVQQKITNQALLLRHINHIKQANALQQLAKRTLSGDTTNMEAQAARQYWKQLFGQHFIRTPRDSEHLINAMLNYGYAILRAATARAVCGAGLNPALGVHHHNKLNPFCLVDDLMEPYRPMVDWTVYFHQQQLQQQQQLTPALKQQLTAILDQDVVSPDGTSPLRTCLYYTAQSFKHALQAKDSKKLTLSPLPPFGRLL